MNLQQIYDKICYKVWGETTVPSQTVNALIGEFGMINNAHQKVQLEYNWWFMEGFATINTVAGVSSYLLPFDYKQIRSALFKVNGKEYFGVPLSPLAKPNGESYMWQNQSGVEYPYAYEIVDDSIVLYPKPLHDDRALHVIYYKLYPRLVNMTDSDNVTENAGDLIVSLVCAELTDARKEYDESQNHRQRYMEDLNFLIKKQAASVENYIRQMGVAL